MVASCSEWCALSNLQTLSQVHVEFKWALISGKRNTALSCTFSTMKSMAAATKDGNLSTFEGQHFLCIDPLKPSQFTLGACEIKMSLHFWKRNTAHSCTFSMPYMSCKAVISDDEACGSRNNRWKSLYFRRTAFSVFRSTQNGTIKHMLLLKAYVGDGTQYVLRVDMLVVLLDP